MDDLLARFVVLMPVGVLDVPLGYLATRRITTIVRQIGRAG